MDELEKDLSDAAADCDRLALVAIWAAWARLNDAATRAAAADELEATLASEEDVHAASDDEAAAAEAAEPAALDEEEYSARELVE